MLLTTLMNCFEEDELADEKCKELVRRLFRTLEKYAKALKPIREEVGEKLREKTEGV